MNRRDALKYIFGTLVSLFFVYAGPALSSCSGDPNCEEIIVTAPPEDEELPYMDPNLYMQMIAMLDAWADATWEGQLAMGKVPPEVKPDDYRKLFKTSLKYCVKSTEDCGAWGQRMVTGPCRAMQQAINACIIAVNDEVTNGCSQVISCPTV